METRKAGEYDDFLTSLLLSLKMIKVRINERFRSDHHLIFYILIYQNHQVS